MKIWPILFLFNVFLTLGHSAERVVVQLNEQGMPICMYHLDRPEKGIVLYWDEVVKEVPRNIYYSRKDLKVNECQKYFLNPITQKAGNKVLFEGDKPSSTLEEFELSTDIQQRLSELRVGKNQHQSDESVIRSLDHFNIKQNKELIKKFNVPYTTKIYHHWISEKNLGNDCSNLIGSCDYYLCREMQKNCKANGYFLGFGYSYCTESMVALKSKVSKQAVKWLDSVASCLQRKTDEISNHFSCSEIKAQSIVSHDECYDQTNFCDLGLNDKAIIIKMIYSEVKDLRIMKEGLQVLKSCLFKNFGNSGNGL